MASTKERIAENDRNFKKAYAAVQRGMVAKQAIEKYGLSVASYYKRAKAMQEAPSKVVVETFDGSARSEPRAAKPVTLKMNLALVVGSPEQIAEFYRKLAK